MKKPEGALKGILGVNTQAAGVDRLQPQSGFVDFDATLTKVSGRWSRCSSWYDNEWGFSNRMLDTTVAFANAKSANRAAAATRRRDTNPARLFGRVFYCPALHEQRAEPFPARERQVRDCHATPAPCVNRPASERRSRHGAQHS
jgi:hypothetical protein